MNNYVGIKDLIGKTCTAIEGGRQGDDTMTLTCADGSRYYFYHSQLCCESVSIEDVEGELDYLLNTPILRAEENSSEEVESADYTGGQSHTWTFYRFATIKGTVVLRWLGESNGYYSESVNFVKLN